MTMAAIGLIGSAVSAYGQYQQGKYQQAAYNLQAQQAELQGRQKALNYSKQAVQVLERQRKVASSLVARGAAAGVDPFTGSAMTVDRYNAFKAGQDYNLGLENADMAIAGGLAQGASLRAAGAQAKRNATIGAFATLAMGVASYGKPQVRNPPGGAPVNAPGYGTISNVGGVQVENLMTVR